MGAKWEVTFFEEQQTHELIKKFSLKKFLRSHRNISKEERDFIKFLHEVNLSSRKIMHFMAEIYGSQKNVPYKIKDVSNLKATFNELQQVGDMGQQLTYFNELREEDPGFFYKIQLDHHHRVEGLFWVDGCGFLRNERIDNFIWLFQAFLEAMEFVQPKNIITDQDIAMKSAIAEVFPTTVHRNCRWHIMKKAQEKLGNFMNKREQLPYFKDHFFPFLQTTARSEGFNVVLKKNVNPHNSIFQFFLQYKKLQESIEVAEDEQEFETEDKILRPWSDYPMEEQALAVYTRPIYLRFRAELRKITSYNM
ncbi:hypothetical protein BRADI_4g17122v3 [Brachypodium distachyon]|uniref:MULE transposase domain-containing protein n=1 Tax=Brachypodium distachyon TaxID=15368 RepID=A0A2K2CNC2_BRADI|nr:hypothetical protein BRADI_4g17122v3 [Brachypodium distachyon]